MKMGVPLLIRADAEAAHRQTGLVLPQTPSASANLSKRRRRRANTAQTKNHRGKLWFVMRADLRHRLVPFNADEVS
jgi:hypothetical protein